MSATVVGSFSWPAVSAISIVPLTIIHIAWYSSLMLGMAAVALALQQSVFLARIRYVSTSEQIICRLLSSESTNRRRIPRWYQILIWQSAVGMLEWCIFLWIGGYAVFIWSQSLTLHEQWSAGQVVSHSDCMALSYAQLTGILSKDSCFLLHCYPVCSTSIHN